ncbi:MAG: D-aminoacylase [Bacillota bacterium]
MFELVLQNGVIVDGSAQPRFLGDVAIEKGRIGAISRRGGTLPGREVLDCRGLVVAPGFVDVHSHADRSVMESPLNRSGLAQGITTVLAGHCGGSAAPLSPAMKERWLARMAAWGLDPAGPAERHWTTLGEFLSYVESRGTGVNIALLVGQGTVRDFVMGHDQRPATPAEIRCMQDLVEASMAAGAFGLSAGRSYVPGKYAPAGEVLELCRAAAKWGGLYACHLISEGERLFEALDEALGIGRDTGMPVQVVHCKVWGKPNWGQAPRLLRTIEQARESGVDVLLDVYPYNYSQVFSLRQRLGRLLPPDLTGALAALEDQRVLDALEKELAQDRELPGLGIAWCDGTPEAVGSTVGEFADAQGLSLARAIAQLLLRNQLQVKVAGLMDEEEVKRILKHPFAMVSTDAGGRDSLEDPMGTVHPRAYGTYPRVLGRYVRDEAVLGLEEAVYKMTTLPARRARLAGRGLLAVGYWADVVVFDPAQVRETSTLDRPGAYPLGIRHVLVNGRLAVSHGRLLDVRAGRVLRHS